MTRMVSQSAAPARLVSVKRPKPNELISPGTVAEGIGTFFLVLMGTGAVVVNQIGDGVLTHLGISGVFGAVVAALIYALGHISGAHFNPAVTLAFWTSGYFPKRKVLGYILAQCIGAIAASLCLRIMFGVVGSLGSTVPLNQNWSQSFLAEALITFLLMLVIIVVATDRRAPQGFAGLAIGLTVFLAAACMGPISGASMNPARSLGPALASGTWQYHWLYWLAPILGAQGSVWVYRYLASQQGESR